MISKWSKTSEQHEVTTSVTDLNLREVRFELTSRIAILTATMGALSVWWRLFGDDLPDFTLLFLGSLFVLGLAVRQLSTVRLETASHLLIWGLTAGTLGAMLL